MPSATRNMIPDSSLSGTPPSTVRNSRIALNWKKQALDHIVLVITDARLQTPWVVRHDAGSPEIAQDDAQRIVAVFVSVAPRLPLPAENTKEMSQAGR
jgi:hypothetical protein